MTQLSLWNPYRTRFYSSFFGHWIFNHSFRCVSLLDAPILGRPSCLRVLEIQNLNGGVYYLFEQSTESHPTLLKSIRSIDLFNWTSSNIPSNAPKFLNLCSKDTEHWSSLHHGWVHGHMRNFNTSIEILACLHGIRLQKGSTIQWCSEANIRPRIHSQTLVVGHEELYQADIESCGSIEKQEW